VHEQPQGMTPSLNEPQLQVQEEQAMHTLQQASHEESMNAPIPEESSVIPDTPCEQSLEPVCDNTVKKADAACQTDLSGMELEQIQDSFKIYALRHVSTTL